MTSERCGPDLERTVNAALPEQVVVNRAGAIVAAKSGVEMKSSHMDKLAMQLNWSVVFDFEPILTLFNGLGLGPVPGHRLERFLRIPRPPPQQGRQATFSPLN